MIIIIIIIIFVYITYQVSFEANKLTFFLLFKKQMN